MEFAIQSAADEVLHSISSINAQSAAIQNAREVRQIVQRRLATELSQPDDSTFSHLLPLLPESYRPLVGALVQENNELLQRVRVRAQQNQALLRKSVEYMQRFITTLSPQDNHAHAVHESTVMTVESASSIYDAIE